SSDPPGNGGSADRRPHAPHPQGCPAQAATDAAHARSCRTGDLIRNVLTTKYSRPSQGRHLKTAMDAGRWTAERVRRPFVFSQPDEMIVFPAAALNDVGRCDTARISGGVG